MAGLPFITARVSSERCTKEGITLPNGATFEIFRVVERTLKEPVQSLGSAIDALQKQVVSGPEKGYPLAVELRKNWYFMKSAIQSAMRDEKAPFGSLPFRVFAEYCRLSSSHSLVEAMRAEAARLTNTELGF